MVVVMGSVNRDAEQLDDAKLDLTSVDRREPVLLHEQVAAEIRRAIADGEALPGQKIPQAKDLAVVLDVNSNTVLRALRLLRAEGLLEMGRGRAIRVAGTPEQGAVVAKLNEVLAFARQRGYRRDELIALMERLPG
jgi:GntR family transcriptional regulator